MTLLRCQADGAGFCALLSLKGLPMLRYELMVLLLRC
jgi:hypothetical protein